MIGGNRASIHYPICTFSGASVKGNECEGDFTPIIVREVLKSSRFIVNFACLQRWALALQIRPWSVAQVKWFLRFLALASTAICGIFFLTFVFLLPRNYNWTAHRFPPYIKETFPTMIAVGAGFLCSGVLYLYLVRAMRPKSKLPLPCRGNET